MRLLRSTFQLSFILSLSCIVEAVTDLHDLKCLVHDENAEHPHQQRGVCDTTQQCHPPQLKEFPQSFRDLGQIRTPRFNTEKNLRHIHFETQLGILLKMI